MKFIYMIIIILFISTLNSQINNNDSINYKNPSLSWRLAIIPGLGQVYNKKYIKSISFITLELYAGYKYIDFKNKENFALRNTYAWWVFGLYIWSILDAYVDAHLSTFPSQGHEFNTLKDSLEIIK